MLQMIILNVEHNVGRVNFITSLVSSVYLPSLGSCISLTAYYHATVLEHNAKWNVQQRFIDEPLNFSVYVLVNNNSIPH